MTLLELIEEVTNVMCEIEEGERHTSPAHAFALFTELDKVARDNAELHNLKSLYLGYLIKFYS